LFTKKHFINNFSAAFLLVIGALLGLKYFSLNPNNFFVASPVKFSPDARRYLTAVGLFLLAFLIIKSSKTKKEIWLKFIFLLFMPSTLYEFTLKSGQLTNSVFCISLYFFAEQKLNEHEKNISFFIFALLFGIFLSTSLIPFVWLAMFLLFFFRNNLKNGALFLSISLMVFLLSLIPFYLWNAEAFLVKGPFAVQSIYLPKWIFFLFPLLVFYVGWMIADFQELLFASGVLTFLLVSISFVVKICEVGMSEAVFNSRFDVSYYVLSVPFFILALKEYNVDRFLGKVYSHEVHP